MSIERIFLDLDDVLNRCTMYALAYVGCPVNLFDDTIYCPEWGWDIVRAANELHPTETFTEKSFWESIERDFWASVPESAEFEWLLGLCADAVGRENVCILSSPTRDPESLSGKLEWIQRYMPKWLHRQFLIGPCKQFCARPSSLLIDDSDKNVNAFRDAGGCAFLFPRPWNTAHGKPQKASIVRYMLGTLLEFPTGFVRYTLGAPLESPHETA